MGVTTTNLLMGPAKVYIAPFGTTEPLNADIELAAEWTDVGGTLDGANINIEQTYTELLVDQIAMRVGSRLTSQNVSVTVNMAEATLANMRVATNTAAGAGTTFELDPTISNAEPNYVAVIFEGQRPGGGNRRFIIRRALSIEAIEMAFTKDGQTVIPTTFGAHYVSDSIKPVKLDDTPTA